MRWNEFRIRLYALKRQQKRQELLTREVCYQIYVSNHFGKKRPVSKQRYWRIDTEQDDEEIKRLANILKEAKKNG